MATLDLEREQQLLELFSEPIRLHLLYKATENTSSMKVDDIGEFMVIVYPPSGTVRGAYVSKHQNESEDNNAFLFDVTTTNATTFTPQVNSKVTFGSSISFGESFVLSRDYVSRKYCWVVKFSSDEVFNTGWEEESYGDTGDNAKLKDVELYRVRRIGELLPCPWREMCWAERTREDLRESFLSHKVVGESVASARVLLLGPSGAGKSSFINAVRSVMFKRITHVPVTSPEAPGRFKKLKSCSIRSGRGGPATSLILCDVMALGEAESDGLSVSDALAVIKGHVPEGYMFNADKPITSQSSGYRAEPGIREKIHGVLFVVDARKITSYSSHLQKTMRELQTEMSDLDVPQLVLLTHVDQVCHAVEEDVEYIYRSRSIRNKIHNAAEFMSMPVSYVLPVKNYSTELSTSCSTDILLLSAVDTILQAVDDTLDYQCANTTTAG